MYFGFVGATFLPITDVSMQKWNNSLLVQVTSGLSIHYFERTVGFFTQNYNQDLLSPVFRGACLIDLVIGAKFPGFRGFLLFENLIFFFNFLESLFSESHRNFLHRTSDFSFWCHLPLTTRNLPEVLQIVQMIGVWVYFFNRGGGGEEL